MNLALKQTLKTLSLSTLLAVCIFVATPLVVAEENEKQIEFFETKIRPVLVEHCYSCHSADAKSVKGGLLLDTKEGVRTGGDSGPALVPHQPDDSVLLNAIRYEDYEMPPKQQLPDSVVADFEKWIKLGAADPRQGKAPIQRKIDIQAGRDFWAFRPIQPRSTPDVTNQTWPTTDVDRFVLARLEKQGLTPVGDSAPEAWLRRVSFDLVGLPPTVEQLDEFIAESSKNPATAKEAVVDRLLKSSHFGERWGRHWLDVARYAESTGRTRNYPFPFAWRYRDYVIQSFNEDKPYDHFVVEQLAGDLLESDNPRERESQLVATGYLALGSPDLNERNPKVFEMDMIADQIDTTCRSLLGLTVGCARCHDHKFDPIPTDDYYALAGIFKSTQLLNGYAARGGGANKARSDLLIKLGDMGSAPEPPSEEEQLTAGLDKKQSERLLKAKAEKDEAAAKVARIKRNKKLNNKERNKQLAKAKRVVGQKQRQLNQLQNKLGRDRKIKIEGPACLGVRESKKIVNCQVHIRGEVNRLGDEVSRGFLQVIGDEENSLPAEQSGRLELANWIASSNNPLTARVMVNRVWRQLFGQGIVRTVDNFGLMGAPPTHPELLDHLANDFMQNAWSTKQLIRKLVLSRTYGLDVVHNAKNAAADENNSLLWRMNSRRLDYEAMRDALLMVGGRLQQSAPTGSFVESLNVNEISKQKMTFDYEGFAHRSVYLPVMRNLIPEDMSYFDFPDGSETRGARDITTVPTQSLFLLNSPFVIDLANSMAKYLVDEKHSTKEIIHQTHRRIFGRQATTDETAKINSYVTQRLAELTKASELRKPKPVESAAASPRKRRKNTKEKAKQKNSGNAKSPRPPAEIVWSEVVHAMFASAEFRYR